MAEMKAVAVAEGMVDLDYLKLADLSKVTLNEETGEIEGAKELLAALKESKPHFFQKPIDTTSTPRETPSQKKPEPKNAMDMTDEEYAKERRRIGSGR